MHFPVPEIAAKRYSRCVRDLIRKNFVFFVVATLAALALRLFFVFRFPAVVDDSKLYANIAENWLQHGIYGVTNSGQIMPTLSRLPGYPAFLAIIFTIFGIENFRAVLLIQVIFDLATCFLVADMARRVFSARAAKAAYVMAGLCPFLVNYAAAALTETLEIFFTTLALNFALRGLGIGESPTATDNRYRSWLICGLSVGGAILLRPDGGILLAAIGIYLGWKFLLAIKAGQGQAHFWVKSTVLVGLGALLPLVPWTIRNFHTLHRFEPLAPRYATDSDELVMTGFNRWVKTWMADYASVQEIYWNVNGEEIDVSKLPHRAFDSAEQKRITAELFADYNRDHDVSPELDARFGQLAAQRIHAAPLRYYVWLPFLRIAAIWLRPRTELSSADPRWWEFNDDPHLIALSVGFGAINLAYVLMASAGLIRMRAFFGIGLFVLFLVLRSAFLGTLENPEPRYTLEMYPAVIFFASALFCRAE
jgi:4-amino-4-deoxy-L-arabinose transferase-like glycosyltransferase